MDYSAVKGVEQGIKLARSRKLISAIRHIESANPEISRERAKEIVHSFGYNSDSRWPEADRQPLRCL